MSEFIWRLKHEGYRLYFADKGKIDTDVQRLIDTNAPLFQVDLEVWEHELVEAFPEWRGDTHPVVFPFQDFIVETIEPKENSRSYFIVVNAGECFHVRQLVEFNKTIIVMPCVVKLNQGSYCISDYDVRLASWYGGSSKSKDGGRLFDVDRIADSLQRSLFVFCKVLGGCAVKQIERPSDFLSKAKLRKLKPSVRLEYEQNRTIDLVLGGREVFSGGVAGGGGEKAPHDRRAHERTLKSGKVIEVKSSKIHGGVQGQQTYAARKASCKER